MSTTPDLADADDNDHYTPRGYLYVEENESARVYRDSMNDGYTNAIFCDDTVMLMVVTDKEKKKRYFQVEGEPTCYTSWKFDQENETVKKTFIDIVEKNHKAACERFKLPEEKVYVVIQLENI